MIKMTNIRLKTEELQIEKNVPICSTRQCLICIVETQQVDIKSSCGIQLQQLINDSSFVVLYSLSLVLRSVCHTDRISFIWSSTIISLSFCVAKQMFEFLICNVNSIPMSIITLNWKPEMSEVIVSTDLMAN